MSDHVSPKSREKAIFLEASDLPAHERSVFLDRACGSDSSLRARVQALLDADQSAVNFLAGDAHRVHACDLARSSRDEVGRQIGPYKLLEVIGEGGFGTVYLAEQEQPVRRRVALKL